MDQVRPCTMADIRTEFRVWEVWTVKEDGSPQDLERTDDSDDSQEYWLCRNCLGEFYYWPEAVQHLEESKAAMAATV